MLAIFDIDGTICDTQSAEEYCYSSAIKDVTGIRLETFNWATFEEPTSSGIVKELLRDDPNAVQKEELIKHRFVNLLTEAKAKYPNDFSPVKGAIEFVQKLSRNGICDIAIASGGFDLEAKFKLLCCGIDLDAIPHATSSDTPKRKDIIPLAADRAGYSISSCVYFGDALWDINVSRELDVPLIGIGRKSHIFQEHCSYVHFRDFSNEAPILEVLESYKKRIQPEHCTYGKNAG